MNTEKKVAFRVTARQLTEIEKIKQKEYFNKTYSSMLRDLLDRGIAATKQMKKGEQ